MSEPHASPAERAARVFDETQQLADPLEQAAAITAILHRASVELLKVARAQAAATKGQPEWGTWAGLQNTTRSLVLQASTCRDLVGKMKKD